MKNDISQRSNNFIVKLWITNHPVYPSSSGFLRVLDRAWHGCTVGLIWLINCEITMHCTMSRFSPTFYFPMKFSQSCPGPGSPHDALRWAVTWRGAGWWHVTSPVSPGLGVSCIFLWRRHFAIVAPCSEQGRQAAAWTEHRECDSRLSGVSGCCCRDSGVIIQLSDLSPTSCLRIPAHFSHSHGWSVILPVVKLDILVI